MKIRIIIADKPYSINIEARDEEVVRRAAKLINERIEHSRRSYDAPTIDHLAMAAFQISIENEQNKLKFQHSFARIELDELARTVEQELAK